MGAVPKDPQTIDEIIKGLEGGDIKIESSKIITSRLLSLKFNRSNTLDFCQQSEKLTESLQRSLIGEGITKEKSREMTIEKTVEMCRLNTRSDLVKAVLAATPFTDSKEVVAKLILESSTEIQEKQILSFKANNKKKFNNNDRGKFRKDYNNRNSNNPPNVSNSQRNNYRGRGNYHGGDFNNRGRGGYSNRGNGHNNYYQNRSARPIKASENHDAPQQNIQLGALTQYGRNQ